MPQRILVVDDEAALRRNLSISLQASGFEVFCARDGLRALACFEQHAPDLILLDLGMPKRSGLEVLRDIRQTSQVPVIVLSVRNQEIQKIEALDAGANDYLTKPFGVGELQARIRVALRNHVASPGLDHQITLGNLRCDKASRQVWKSDVLVKLTKTEYRVLACLLNHVGAVVTHKQMLSEIWGEAYLNETHYLQVYISQLRHKLEDDPACPVRILTEPGVGYRLT